MLGQKLDIRLLQKMSPQQMQLMRLLEVPLIELEQRIKQEIEENPALEEGVDEEQEETTEYETEEISADDRDEEEKEELNEPEINNDNEFTIEDFVDTDDDDIQLYKSIASNISRDDERKEVPYSSVKTFQEQLLSQLGEHSLDDRKRQIAEHIIGNIDDSGYLQREIESMADDMILYSKIESTHKEIKDLVALIQQFDPAGVGARNLQECLFIQLKRTFPKTKDIKIAGKIIENNFEDFSKKNYDKIIRNLGITEEQLKNAINEILKLNPKPGAYIEDSRSQQYIIPDFILTNNDGELELYLNSKNSPELRISKTYLEMLNTYSSNKKKNPGEKEALQFVRQKTDSAKWFIDALKERQITLLKTMTAIIEYQKEYFYEGDESLLKPMILKDISEKINYDLSTVSRVVNSKYIQTHFGTLSLKSFFSEATIKEDGEEVSTRETKRVLLDIIAEEDKRNPLNDDALTKILHENGFKITRRTVAKYRETLNIPTARMRKEI